MTDKREEAREKLTIIMSQCYSKDGSACKLHTVFQPQKAINIILSLPELEAFFKEKLKAEGYKSPEEINQWLGEQGAIHKAGGVFAYEPLRLVVKDGTTN